MCRYGDIYWADVKGKQSIQSGRRPYLIVANDCMNRFSNMTSAIPLSTSRKKPKLPTHVLIKGCGLAVPSMVLAEQVTILCQSDLQGRIGSILGSGYEESVKLALRIQLNLLDDEK